MIDPLTREPVVYGIDGSLPYSMRMTHPDPRPILARHLSEARATHLEITLTRHDVACLVRIRDAWNVDRVSRNDVCLSLTDVLRNVLESTAGLVDPRKEDGR